MELSDSVLRHLRECSDVSGAQCRLESEQHGIAVLNWWVPVEAVVRSKGVYRADLEDRRHVWN